MGLFLSSLNNGNGGIFAKNCLVLYTTSNKITLKSNWTDYFSTVYISLDLLNRKKKEKQRTRLLLYSYRPVCMFSLTIHLLDGFISMLIE